MIKPYFARAHYCKAQYLASSKPEFFLTNLRIKVIELVYRWIEQRRLRERLLHGALDESVWQC